MNKSESIIKVAQGLQKFQATAKKITKDAKNPHYKSKYASLSNILDEITGPLGDAGLVITQLPEGDEDLVTMLIHADSGEFLQSNYKISAIKKDPQAMGSAITYARRYALASILSLNIDDDDDGNAASGKEDKKAAAGQQTQNNSQPPNQPPPAETKPEADPAAPGTHEFNTRYTKTKDLLATIGKVVNATQMKELFAANSKAILAFPNLLAACNTVKERLIQEQKNKYSQKYESPDAVQVLLKMFQEATNLELVKSLHYANSHLVDRDPALFNILGERIRFFNDKADAEARAKQNQK